MEKLLIARPKESKTIDYKRELHKNPDDLLADVSAFANTAGGVIVFGIEEVDGEPTSIAGLNISNQDEQTLRLSSIIEANLDPPLRGCGFDWLAMPDQKTVLILRIPQSGTSPHRIKTGRSKFYLRGEAGNTPMDSYDLRNAFNAQGLSSSKFRAFVFERCREILARRNSFPLESDGYAVLHVMPVSAVSRPIDAPIADLRDATKNIRPPLSDGGWSPLVCIDGVAIVAGAAANAVSYMQLFRNGTIEAISPCLIPNPQYEGISLHFLERFDDQIASYISASESVGAIGPWMAALSFVDCLGKTLYVGGFIHNSRRTINEEIMTLPIIDWIGEPVNWTDVLHNFADRFANYFGLDRSPFFDKDGKLKIPWQPDHAE